MGPVLDIDLRVGASFKFHLLCEVIFLPEMKEYTGWWGKMSSSWRRQDMKAAPRTGVTGGHQVHTQIKAASTECDFPQAHFPEGLLCAGATATGMPKT